MTHKDLRARLPQRGTRGSSPGPIGIAKEAQGSMPYTPPPAEEPGDPGKSSSDMASNNRKEVADELQDEPKQSKLQVIHKIRRAGREGRNRSRLQKRSAVHRKWAAEEHTKATSIILTPDCWVSAVDTESLS